MDRIIKRFDSVQDGDLVLCEQRGVAHQTDMTFRGYVYDSLYWKKVNAYDGTEIAKAVNKGRCDLLQRHLKHGAAVLDYGSGSGAFMRDAEAIGFKLKGYDVILQAAQKLTDLGALSKDPYLFEAVTFWDTIEHLDCPEQVLSKVRKGAYVFASLPVFDDLKNIRASKHYRPGEHLYYWTDKGFVDWMALLGFRLIERSDHEVQAGRESIGAFVFCRDLPDYNDHIAAYDQIHSTRYYGNSAATEYLDIVASVVKERQPKSILDYGCGRSDLAPYFWRDGERRIARYDPAIPAYKTMPEGKFDLVLCCDVMEHIPMFGVDQVLAEVQSKGSVALFAISTILARAKLPDGRNAHVTILTKSEWTRWVKSIFASVQVLKAKHDHELILLAGTGRQV